MLPWNFPEAGGSAGYNLTVANGGTLELSNVNSLSTNSAVNVIALTGGVINANLAGGTFADTGLTFSLQGGTLEGNAILNNAYTVTDAGTANSTTAVPTTSFISGTAALTLNGAGALVAGDTLKVNNSSTTILGSALTGAGNLTQTAGTLELTGYQ